MGFYVNDNLGILERMRIDPDGNVGIGTTDPQAELEVAGQIKITGGTPADGKVLTSDANGLGTWEYAPIPTGAVMAFDLGSCPAGWSDWSSAEGRVIVGLDTAQSEFDTKGETGGAKTHTLSINEMPSHSHTIRGRHSAGDVDFRGGKLAETLGASTGETGGDRPHNNLQPYVVLRYCIKD